MHDRDWLNRWWEALRQGLPLRLRFGDLGPAIGPPSFGRDVLCCGGGAADRVRHCVPGATYIDVRVSPREWLGVMDGLRVTCGDVSAEVSDWKVTPDGTHLRLRNVEWPSQRTEAGEASDGHL